MADGFSSRLGDDGEGTPTQPGDGLGYFLSWVLLAGTAAFVMLLLSLPLRVPVGAMYWDTYTYYDAANRILSGQTPVRDFFMPAGPLGYAVAALWIWAFPHGQPALLLHWSSLTLSLPLMALVLAGLPREDRGLCLWLVLPFLLFSLLPFNGKEYYPFPGSDGFAYYNRQVSQILYPLIAGLIFLRRKLFLTALIVAAMLALFFLKITGFLAAGLICLFALMAGRLSLRDALLAALAFAATLAAVEIASGLVSGYLADVLVLLRMNTGTLLPRVLQALSINFGVFVALVLLVAALVLLERAALRSSLGRLSRERSAEALTALLDRASFWLAAITVAGIAFETQNTAGQAMIFVWPALLWAVREHASHSRSDRGALTVLVLAGAVYLPLVVNIVERATRAYVGSVGNVAFAHRHLGVLGSLNARPQVVARARAMASVYAEHRAAFDDIAARGEMPSALLYSDFDFQILYLMALDEAIDAIRMIEVQRRVRFETMMLIDFANPLPWLMGRRGPVAVTVGSDPFRAVPPLDAAARSAVSGVDIALLPTCPPTPATLRLARHFEEPLSAHRRARLTQCHDVLMHPRFRL